MHQTDEMKLLGFIPCYNDTKAARKIINQVKGYRELDEILLIDDSDDLECKEIAQNLATDPIIKLIQRKRSGKWSAWRIALEKAVDYDGMIQMDSDIEIDSLTPIIDGLQNFDVITAYQEIVKSDADSLLSRQLAFIYRRAHLNLRENGKFNMGGRLIALSKHTIRLLLDNDFFKEPVPADDHVIALAGYVLGLKVTSIDCGMKMKLPDTLGEWIRYRSRHRGAITWAENYVASKINYIEKVREISKRDYQKTLIGFLKAVMHPFHPLNSIALVFLVFTNLLPLEHRVKWTKLKSTLMK